MADFCEAYGNDIKSILEAVKNGTISEDLINTAVRRIIAWKLKYLSLNGYDAEEEQPEKNEEQNPGKNDNTTLIIVLSVIGGW